MVQSLLYIRLVTPNMCQLNGRNPAVIGTYRLCVNLSHLKASV